ncbi:Oligosaccharide translocation protein RFT1 [Exophiala dermatitidis]
METDQSALSGSGAVLLILIQVASRALTFIGNQFLLRFLSPSLLGIAVQLELVSVTSLYFARESLRVALQRKGSLTTVPPPGGGVVNSSKGPDESTSNSTTDSIASHATEAQTVINLSYLAVLLGFGISTFFGISYLQSAPAEVTQSPYFDISFQIYAVATLVELLAEPAFVVIQQKALFKERARAETSAAVARCLAACLAAVLGHRRGLDPSILPFAVGQAAYAVVLLLLYFVPVVQISKRDKFSLIPRRLETEAKAQELGSSSSQQEYYINLFHVDTLGLAATMYMQSIFKLVLTQGDALILSFLSTLADQGSFALASNYGGLLARLVFQPVEESSRNIFGRWLSSPTSASSSSSAAAGEAPSSANRDGRNQTESAEEKGTGTGEKDTDTGTTTKTKPKTTTQRTSKIPIPIPIPNQHRQALSYLATTLHFYFLMTLPLVGIAPYILPMLVRQVIGADWYTDSTASLLSAYCYYIPLMAVNGILDAFVTSVATPTQLRAQSGWMVLFTALYGVAAWLLLKKFEMGATGLVGANMVNMGLRIVWSVWFIWRWIRNDVEANRDKGRDGSSTTTGTETAAATATLIQREILIEALPAKTCLVVAALVGLGLSMATTTAPSTGTYTGTGLDRQLLGLVVAATVLLGSTM